MDMSFNFPFISSCCKFWSVADPDLESMWSKGGGGGGTPKLSLFAFSKLGVKVKN